MFYPFQRKFLLQSFDLSLKQISKGVCVTTFYTKISPKETLKFQSLDEKYFLIKNDLREEISKKEFDKAKEKALMKVLSKKSYELPDEKKRAFLQIYKEDRLFVLKVFFKSEEEACRFKCDERLQLLRELDERFNSKNLILYDYKKAFFDIHTCFNIIGKNQNFTLNFPQSLHANDGFRVLLFYLLCGLKSQMRKKYDMADLHFIVLKICVFLKNTIKLFDATMARKLLSGFESLEKKIKQNLTKKYFNIKPYRDLLSDFELFLREGDFFKSVEKESFLKTFVAHRLRLKLIIFKKNSYKNFSYEEFMAQCLEIRIFLEHFAHFFNDKNLQKLALIFDENVFVKFMKKREKIFKLIKKVNKNLKIYKG